MKIEKIFSTVITQGELETSPRFNQEMVTEIKQHSLNDKMGRNWSATNYRGGYTSYASLSDMHYRSPLFLELQKKLQPHVQHFAKTQGWNLKGLFLEMNSCWMNIMGMHTYHTLHLHPHSVVSGVYYLSVPPGSVSLRLEDPRMMFYMNAPVRRESSYYEIKPVAGQFVLFESWLRHEVPPNQSQKPRISISFNYSVNEDSCKVE